MTFAAATGAKSSGAGALAFSDVGSPVQLFIDCELVGFVEHLITGTAWRKYFWAKRREGERPQMI